MVSAKNTLSLNPYGKELKVASFCNYSGFVKFCNHLAIKLLVLGLFNLSVVSVCCAVCLQLILTVIKVFICLLLSFLLKKFIKIHSCTLDFKITYTDKCRQRKISLKLGIFNVYKSASFSGDPYPV